VEVVDMAARAKTVSGVKKGDKFICPECNKMRVYESNGKCGSCNHRARLALKLRSGVVPVSAKKPAPKNPVATDHEPDYFGSGVLPTGPVVKASAEYTDLNTDVVSVSASFGKVTNAVGDKAAFGVDPVIVMALRDAWAEVEQSWLIDLSGVKPGTAICYAAKMLDALKGLGY
jgi:hypothetical protein